MSEQVIDRAELKSIVIDAVRIALADANENSKGQQYVSFSEAAKEINLSRQTISKYVKQARLIPVRGKYLLSDVRQAIKERSSRV